MNARLATTRLAMTSAKLTTIDASLQWDRRHAGNQDFYALAHATQPADIFKSNILHLI